MSPAASGFTGRLLPRNARNTHNGHRLRMRKLTVLVVVSLLAFAGVTGAGARNQPPPFPQLPGNWSHAEINVTIKKQLHTLILDRGRITQANATQLTLLESGGVPVTVQLSPDTIIMFRGFRVTPFALRRGLFAETMRIDGGAAVRVRVTLRA